MALSNIRWYHTAKAAILLLVLFPPAGLYVMWRFQGWDSQTKRVVTGAAALWTAAVISAICLAVVLAGGGEEDEQLVAVSPQEAALLELEADSERPVHRYFQQGFPRFVNGSVPVDGADAVERARNFLETYKDLYLQSDPDLALAVRDTIGPGGDGLEYVIFYQTYRGYPVHAGEIVVSLDGDRVFATVGGLLSDVVLNTLPAVSAREAEDAARDDLALPDAPVFGDTTLLVFDESLLDDVPADPHMAWQVTLSDPDPWRVFVDAHTGRVLFRHPLGDYFDLEVSDAENEANAEDSGCYHWSWDPELCDEDDYSEYSGDREGEMACQCAADAYYFYLNNFGRDSYDNDDGQVEVYIRATVDNAYWRGNDGGCTFIEFGDGWVACDTMLHEFTHAVMDYRPVSTLPYAFQQGALEESLADTFAYLYDPGCLLGEDRRAIGAGRNFCDPPSSPRHEGAPDRMGEWIPGEEDHGGVHRNVGIMNKAAYLIAEGGTHPDTGVHVDGIGRPALAQLYYAATAGVTGGYQFIDWRNLVVAVADQWSQNGTNDFTPHTVCQVRNGFFAVEVGWGDYGCDGFEDPPETDDDGDGVMDMVDNCILTFNPGQENTDVIVNPPGDGTGDACDPDVDDDGVAGIERCVWDPYWAHDHPESCADNCPYVPNPDQKDFDRDGKGDVCDDDDGDGVFDDVDNCPDHWNPDQANLDPHLDDDGDACDPDADGDGRSNDNDNCWYDANPNQENSDRDSFGDVCDPCPDVPNESYACAVREIVGPGGERHWEWYPIFNDSDGDGTPDACDDTFNVAPGLAEEARTPVATGKFLKPDGLSVQVELEVDPSGYFKIPLQLSPAADDDVQPSNGCGPGDPWKPETVHCPMCQDAFPQGQLALLVLTSMPSNVWAWVSDEEGRTWDSRYKGEMRVFRFRPQGGRRYFLYLSTSPDIEPGERVTFSAVMSVGPRDEQVGPTPGTTPSPTPTPTPSLTPTPTPAPRPTPTPTPAPTAAPTPTPTPTPTLREETLLATADSWVNRQDPGSPSGGSDTTLWVVDYSGDRTARSFLRFNLSSIPSDATISQGTLRLFYHDCDFGPAKVDVGLYRVTSPWAESTLSWNDQPSFSGAAKDVVSLGCSGATGVYIEWDATGLVRDWVSGSAPNRGMLLKATSETGASSRLLAGFGSREGTASQRPKLVVSYLD